jgi:hypothetical protein
MEAIMKSLRHFLIESARTYRYTIKIAGELDKNFLELFKHNLKKFDPVKIDEPKTTPVQQSPYGFPDLENESVTIIKAEFKYPATEPQIIQMAQLLGHNVNRIRVVTSDFDDSINNESDKYANQASPALGEPDLEDNGKQASKEYANQYLDRVMPKKSSIDIPYAAKKTPTVANTSKDKVGTQSPMSKIKLPPKPQTGARK